MRPTTLLIAALTLPGLAALASGHRRAGLALLRVAAGIEERARRRPTCAGGRSGHVGRGYTSREEAKAVAEAALRGWLLAMVEQVGGVMP